MNNHNKAFQMSLFEEEKQETNPSANILNYKQKPGKPPAVFVSELTSSVGDAIYLHPRANRFIDLDGGYIGYELNYTRRRSLGIYVSEQGVSVNVPRRALVKDIEAFIKEKAQWIFKKLKEHKDRQHKLEASRIHWCDGAELSYLGRPMLLSLRPDEQITRQIEHNGQYIILSLANVSLDAPEATLREQVQRWMQDRALAFFKERCAYYAPILNVNPVSIKLTNASTRWGSASADGAIRLHWRLIEMPLELLDYVVVHELAHLHEMNHGKRYWSLVQNVLPDYKKRRLQLKNKILPIW